MADDNDDLVLDDDEGTIPVTQAAAPPAAGIIPEDDRQIPTTADPSIYQGPIAPYVYVRAHHNMPGWNLWATEPPLGPRDGWIPNNEEGVRAVELGFAEIIEPPAGVRPPS